LLIVNSSIIHWKEHVRDTLQPLLEAYQCGLETGDLEFAAYGAHSYCFNSYAIGNELVQVAREMTTYNDAIRQIKQVPPLTWSQIYQQAIANLMGCSANPIRLVGEFYNEETGLPQHEAANDGPSCFGIYFNRLFLYYLFSEYAQAVENSIIAERYWSQIIGTVVTHFYHLYDALARLATYTESSAQTQAKILEKVSIRLEKMKQLAHHAPMNFQHNTI
jgi:predicted ATPase